MYPDGAKYVGTWRDGRQDGKGAYTWPDGRVYDGEYKDGIKDGIGTLTWPDGKKYEGQWKNGSFHGTGVYTVGGRSRTAEFKNGDRICWKDDPESKSSISAFKPPARDELSITLDLGTEKVLGVDVDYEDAAVLRVVKIREDGFASKWNPENPTLCVKVGDCIVSINGVRGNSKSMLDAAKGSQKLELIVQRPSKIESL